MGEKFISCIQPRDLAWGVRGNRYDRGLEVYHPNFCSRQLGFRQSIPVPFFDSIHCGTSFRLQTHSEAIFRAARRSLDVMRQAARHSVVLNFECTSLFSSWWEEMWTRKYGGDLKVNHDRIFSQLSLKSYPSSGELANWKDMIQEKNRLLLIASVDTESEAIESENDSADAAVLHGAAAEAERREAGEGTDVSESLGDSGAEETIKEIAKDTIKASKRKRVAITKTIISDPALPSATTRPILTRKSKRARVTVPPKPAASSAPVSEAGKETEQSSRPQASKRSTLASKKESRRAATPKEATRKESLSPQPTLDATPSSQFDPSTGIILHFVDEDDTLPSSGYEPLPPSVVLDKEPIVPEIPVALDTTISQMLTRQTVDEPPSSPQNQPQDVGTGSGTTFPSVAGGEKSSPRQGVSAFSGETPGLSQRASPKETSPPPMARNPRCFQPPSSSGYVDTSLSRDEPIEQTEIAPSIGIISPEETVMPDPSPSFFDPAKLPKLFEALGRLETRLKSSKQASTKSMSSEQQQIFQTWAKKEFTASFSLKALCDLERVITEFLKNDRLSKPQYDSFLSFFENLRAFREQHQRADRLANRAKCFIERESSSSTQVSRLMEESMQTKERIEVVSSEIQKLERQLMILKAEQTTLLDNLEQQIEGVEKATLELEQTKSELVNSHTVLAEPNRIFTIMRTYHSRIITLCEDVKFLE
ncbi:uncharacterized protein LOC126617104 [Malus sylvestris]|uniref:uncharacterized protein LOC126617104 n=1 Tax=Malus sylvestris TaxID=3752 RepID=UPI0021AD3C05|nr:uncharacterized protein LOC126617104 [Malus sylvestris]